MNDKAKARVAALVIALRSIGVDVEAIEYRFHPHRLWRFDLAWPSMRLAVEIDGGEWVVRKGAAVGRHAHTADYEKLNEAAVLGWHVLRFTGTQIDRNPADCAEVVKRAMETKAGGV